MRIVFTGGGTGGHFYPILAIAEAVIEVSRETPAPNGSSAPIEMYYFSTGPADPELLGRYGLSYRHVPGGKLRLGFSFKNIADIFVTAWGACVALWKLFLVYPDVVLGKGGFASFPTLFAARILGIPVVIHESDTVPGRVNRWAGKFARYAAVSYPDSARFFPEEKVAHTGQPIRSALMKPPDDPKKALRVPQDVSVITVLGGSQGAVRLNDFIIRILPELLARGSVVHQTGEENYEEVAARTGVALENNEHKNRYRPRPFLSEEDLAAVGGGSSLIISRAGSALFEIARWKVPSIIVPIPRDISRDQTDNAFAYARSGAAVVIEEENLSSTIFLNEVDRVLGEEESRRMREAAGRFAPEGARYKIAGALLAVAYEH